jgi:hypothetical protein
VAARGTYAGKPHGCEQRFLGPPGEQAWTIASMCAEIRTLLEEARDAAAAVAPAGALP